MLELGFVQVVISAPVRQQVGVAADLNNSSVLHRDDLIGMHDGRDTEMNNQSSAFSRNNPRWTNTSALPPRRR